MQRYLRTSSDAESGNSLHLWLLAGVVGVEVVHDREACGVLRAVDIHHLGGDAQSLASNNILVDKVKY